MAQKLSRDRTRSIPEMCTTLTIAKAPLYRWVNAEGGMSRNRSPCAVDNQHHSHDGTCMRYHSYHIG